VLVDLLPGARNTDALLAIRDVAVQLSNVRMGGLDHLARYDAYIRWANESERRLRTLLRNTDLEKLILTKRYWALLSMAMSAQAAPITHVLDNEIDDRVRVLEDVAEALRHRIESWSRPGVFVLPDTSMFISCPEKLEDWDVAATLRVREEPIHVLVPIIVVDELDRLKESGKDRSRWRAGYSLAVLDRVVGGAKGWGRLKAEDFSALDEGGIPRGEVTVEVVLDPPGHTRLPLPDDEIIDRALSTQTLASRAVTLVTYDTGQSMRARAAGLRAIRLVNPLGPEPS